MHAVEDVHENLRGNRHGAVCPDVSSDVAVRGDDDPLGAAVAGNLLDQAVGTVAEACEDDGDAAYNRPGFMPVARFPAVEDDGDVMSPELPVRAEPRDQRVTLLFEVAVFDADQVVPVYDDGGNGAPLSDRTYYSIGSAGMTASS